VERIFLGNMDVNLNILKNRNIRNIIGSMEHVNLEEITRTLQQLSIGKLNAENVNELKSILLHYGDPLVKSPKLITDKLLELSKPALQEIGLFSLTCLGPWFFLFMCYLSTALISFSKYLSERLRKPEGPAISRAIAIITSTWSNYTKFYHDQTFIGLEHIPKNSAALLIWYHGPIPVDYFGLVAKIYQRDGRLVNTIVDRCLQMLPGFENVQKYLKASASGKGYCVDLLENGELLAVAPGGSREALFDESYSTSWGDRTGFAKVALLTGVPIIPIFTENIREAYSTMRTGRLVWKYIFDKTKLPMIPIYGGFPVKLTTHVGEPIRAHKDETATQLKVRVQAAIENMIATHQRPQQKIIDAVLERVDKEDLEKIDNGLAKVSEAFKLQNLQD